MNTFGKLAFSSSTALLSICEQKDTSSKERSLHDSRSFLKDAGLTILVPVFKKSQRKHLKYITLIKYPKNESFYYLLEKHNINDLLKIKSIKKKKDFALKDWGCSSVAQHQHA